MLDLSPCGKIFQALLRNISQCHKILIHMTWKYSLMWHEICSKKIFLLTWANSLIGIVTLPAHSPTHCSLTSIVASQYITKFLPGFHSCRCYLIAWVEGERTMSQSLASPSIVVWVLLGLMMQIAWKVQMQEVDKRLKNRKEIISISDLKKNYN